MRVGARGIRTLNIAHNKIGEKGGRVFAQVPLNSFI